MKITMIQLNLEFLNLDDLNLKEKRLFRFEININVILFCIN